jgi:hypothetical protein
MSDQIDEIAFIQAVRAETDRIARLLGDAWPGFKAQFDNLIEQTEKAEADDRQLWVDELLELGLKSPASDIFRSILARTQSANSATSLVIPSSLEPELAALVAEMRLPASVIKSSADIARQMIATETEPTTRTIVLAPDGLGGGKSVKLRNLHLDVNQLSGLTLGAIAAVQNAVDKPHPLVIAAGVLLTIRSLIDATTVKISERDATVFWGLTQARDKDDMARESDIREQTNKARNEIGLDSLSENEVRNALHTLESLKSVEAVAKKRNTWRIMEKYKIRG